MKTVALRSLGCKVNAYETEGMQQILQQNGYLVVPFDKKADVYIVNTCSVTNIADQKSRQMLHRAKKMNPDAVVVAAGCYVQTGYEKLLEDASVDLIVGNNEKRNIFEILCEYFGDEAINDSKTKYVTDMTEKQDYEEMQVLSMAEHTRAFIKIQDGCNRFCTYCVIPYARGRIRSRKIEDVVKEATALSEVGYKEIVLTGIHISSFGLDRGESELIKLIEKLSEIPKINRIRLGSLEPTIVTDEFVDKLKKFEKICPHFHLSMQSGSKTVLERMNRHYTPDEYYDVVNRLRNAFDNPAITTDVIVGFPGESEEEFIETYEFCKKINFYEMHVFKYSRRDGTVAAKMPNQIAEQEKNRRSEKLISLGNDMSHAYRETYEKRSVQVLFEEIKTINGKDYWIGHSREYIQAALEVDGINNTNYENEIVAGKIDGFISDNVMKFEI